MDETIQQLNRRLDALSHVEEPLGQDIQRLLTSVLRRKTHADALRNSLLRLAENLNRLQQKLTPQLIVQLISSYAEKNQSVIQKIIADNLNRNQQLQQQLSIHIQLLAQRLCAANPPELLQATQLRLIALSHPSLIKEYYTSSHQEDINPFNELTRLITQQEQEEQRQQHNAHDIRRELLFIIIHVLKHGIIPRLRSATVAFDSSPLKQQLFSLLSSKSTRLLTELYLNYPSLIRDLEELTGTNNSKAKQDPLAAFFSAAEDHPIFKIYNGHQPTKNNDRPELTSIVNEVLSVLPDLASPQTLRSIIEKHAEFQDAQQGAQRLIERSFSDPQFIPSHSPLVNPSLPDDPTANRRNIFDEQRMDPNLLRIGKIKLDENEIMNDKSHLTKEMKNQIKARLERIEDEERAAEAERSELVIYSDDEEDAQDEKTKRVLEQVVDIFSDDDHRFKVGHEDGDDLSDPEEPSRPSSPLPAAARSQARGKAAAPEQQSSGLDARSLDEAVLCAVYLDDPAVFLPSARGSKRRLALKDRLLSTKQDDLIEAWKTMFERNPQKDEILEKYRLQTALQAPNNRGTAMADPGGDGSRGRGERAGRERGRGGGPGGGERGRGGNRRGRGGRPGPSAPTDPTGSASSSGHPRSSGTDAPRGGPSSGRARTHHSKSLTHRKVRGRDKKLALIGGGGGGGPPGPN
ncbi:hypothetical protein PTTG_27136 [Puccinia triticina 1-1 BBBD Race 1]|uniref:CUE domain-containing protein n=1 Tax=Puccinia triticina (isolate 1-1 / race 1 (BBBD)) TaxID=630390 RepID=A0A180GMS9_PUCT1|nr:hypothetical protein PTTG_27136 [Puccinia triticina 1-1 BBBD Race 1]